MRIKNGFLLKEVAGEYVAVPFEGNYENLGAMISLNETGAFLWQLLEEDTDAAYLENELVKRYGVEPELAEKAVLEFTESLRERNLLED